MKQFFKMMFASAFGVLLGLGILSLILLSTAVGFIASVGSTPAYTPKENTVFKIKLQGTLADNSEENPFAYWIGEEEETLSLKDLLETIQIAKHDERIKGIYIEAGMLSAGSASLDALRRALIDFRENGKFVVAYADHFSQGNYYLCSVADRIFLNPQGILELQGLASQTLFYKGLMDKLGVEMQIFKVGTYKGAVEPFMLDKLSDANREQIQSYLSSIWNNITEGIAQARGISAESVNQYANEGLTFADPMKTVEYGLVDSLKYKPEAEAYVKELAGQKSEELNTASVSQMKTLLPLTSGKEPQVAILYAEGEIKEQVSSRFYDMEQVISENTVNELIKLKNDDQVKAVVFRINSPGGSAYLSEQIWRQVVELKKVKPVVVSMGDVAASGGYYIACSANKIIAEPNTLTGSIGIFGMFPNVAGLFGKLDLTSDIVKTNALADMGDPSRPMTESEKALVQGYVERGYQTFLSRCAEGRGMTTTEIDAVGQGRVWSGEQAIEKGLVDALGGIDLAIQTAAELAELETYETTTVSSSKNFIDEFLDKQLGSVKLHIAKNILGDEFEYFKKLREIRESQGIMARLPYDIKPL